MAERVARRQGMGHREARSAVDQGRTAIELPLPGDVEAVAAVALAPNEFRLAVASSREVDPDHLIQNQKIGDVRLIVAGAHVEAVAVDRLDATINAEALKARMLAITCGRYDGAFGEARQEDRARRFDRVAYIDDAGAGANDAEVVSLLAEQRRIESEDARRQPDQAAAVPRLLNGRRVVMLAVAP